MMIPTPQAGILRRVEGYELVPLPEGSSYLGFIFAHHLRMVVMPLWKGECAQEAGRPPSTD